MDENPQRAAKEILDKAFAPPQETETEPTEEQETALTSETLETQQAEPEAEAEPQPETEGDEISTLNKLAETLDIPIEDMYALNFNMPNGDPVTLGNLKDFYEQNSDLESARQQIENERQQLKEQQNGPPISQEHVEAIANVRMIENEWQNLESSGLKQSDPGQYSVKALELQQKYAQASGVLNNINQVVESKRSERIAANQQELYKLNPELKEEPKRQEAVNRVTNLFNQYGVNPDYLGDIEDPKAIHMLLEVAKLFESRGDFRKKRIDTAPKVLKPQAVKNSQAGKQAALKRLTEKARQSGQRRDQVNAVSALLRK